MPDHTHHHHHHAPVEHAPADPAQQALADALRVSFGILKALMIVLVVIYLFSGLYQVQPQEQAVQLVFGHITGDTDDRIKQPGWHLGWPFPIGEVVKVPTTTQNLAITDTFMFQIAENNRGKSYDDLGRGAPLNPEKDGSLITADANLVHGIFNASYTITNAADFIQNIGDPANPTDQQRLRTLLRTALEQAIVHATAQTTSDDFIGGRAKRALIKQLAQNTLDSAATGVTLGEVTLNQPTMPLSVRDAYNLVSQAENVRSEQINQAQTARREALGGVAGAAALPVPGGEDGPLVELIKRYELAATAGDTHDATTLKKTLDDAFRNLHIEFNTQGFDIGGEAAQLINQAKTDRTTLIQTVRAEADAFQKLLENYRRDPQLFRALTWQQARADIFADGSDIETFMAPQGQLYLELNRDPEITRQRERNRLQRERDARQQLP